jgi:hypothetical protein
LAGGIVEATVGGLTSAVSSKLIEKTFDVVVRRFPTRRTLKISLLYGSVYTFHDLPRYDECLQIFDRLLSTVRESKDILNQPPFKYLYHLYIVQKEEPLIPLLVWNKKEFEEYLSESIYASSVRLFLIPLLHETISIDILASNLNSTYTFLRYLEESVRKSELEINEVVKYVRFHIPSDKRDQFLKNLKSTGIVSTDLFRVNYDSTRRKTVVTAQIYDSAVINLLVDILKKVK